MTATRLCGVLFPTWSGVESSSGEVNANVSWFWFGVQGTCVMSLWCVWFVSVGRGVVL